MKQHGYTPPASPFRALSWQSFGQTLKKPPYGAIGIKQRCGGGHVAFLLGQSRDGKHSYLLGGNQDDAVNVKRYEAGVWGAFTLPPGAVAGETLRVYKGTAAEAGAEA